MLQITTMNASLEHGSSRLGNESQAGIPGSARSFDRQASFASASEADSSANVGAQHSAMELKEDLLSHTSQVPILKF